METKDKKMIAIEDIPTTTNDNNSANVGNVISPASSEVEQKAKEYGLEAMNFADWIHDEGWQKWSDGMWTKGELSDRLTTQKLYNEYTRKSI